MIAAGVSVQKNVLGGGMLSPTHTKFEHGVLFVELNCAIQTNCNLPRQAQDKLKL